MNTKCLIYFLFVSISIVAISCKNNDNVYKTTLYTGLTVVNASADTLNFYLNGTRQNNSSSLFPGGSIVNLTVSSGLQNYQFKKAGNSAALFSYPLTLTTDTYNSLYITGESPSGSFNTVDTLYTDTATNFSTVRFVNASPDAGNLDVFVGDTANFKSRAFKSSSTFLVVGSGLKEIKIYQSGITTKTLVDTSVAINSNAVYTLFSKGLLKGTGNSRFNLGIIVN